jgi:cytochrome c biogenesis protein CcmG, thiol:disulfide interchange protein DsbE
MFSLKALAAVLVSGAILSVPIYFYWEYLTQGMRPPEATLKLNDLEKDGVPDFEVTDLAGKAHRLTDFRGKVVVVNFWATWCAPCVKEFPSLQGLARKMDGKVIVLAVSYDRSREDIDTFIKAFGGTPDHFVVAWDPDRKTSPLFGTQVLPETYILSGEGKLMRKIAGETTWDDPGALEFFEELFQSGGSNPPSGN